MSNEFMDYLDHLAARDKMIKDLVETERDWIEKQHGVLLSETDLHATVRALIEFIESVIPKQRKKPLSVGADNDSKDENHDTNIILQTTEFVKGEMIYAG